MGAYNRVATRSFILHGIYITCMGLHSAKKLSIKYTNL